MGLKHGLSVVKNEQTQVLCKPMHSEMLVVAANHGHMCMAIPNYSQNVLACSKTLDELQIRFTQPPLLVKRRTSDGGHGKG